jgi:predicted ferric reductase
MTLQAEMLKQKAQERARLRQSRSQGMARPVAQPPAKQTRSVKKMSEVEPGDLFWGTVLGSLLGVSLAAAGLLLGIGVLGVAGNTKSFWYLSRSSGFVAYLLLWGSVVWGLLLSSKISNRLMRPFTLLDAHQFLSNVAIGFALFHGLILMGDRFLSFSLGAVLVPFAGEYEPLLVAAGQLGMWLSLLLVLSFYVRRWTGHKAWRFLHYSSFLGYWMVLIHAVMLGTDTKLPWVQLFYLLTGGVVIFLTYYRIFTAGGRRTSRQLNTAAAD